MNSANITKSPRRESLSGHKKDNFKKNILLIFLLLFLCFTGFIAYYTIDSMNQMKYTALKKDNESLGINQEVVAKNSDDSIVNIALFGIDARVSGDTARSDSIMIGTVDFKHKKIKLSSIMRDSYVNIPGHGKDKITHAYAYGGPELAIKTINQNFGLDIKDYMTVNFYGMEDVIDSIGGVTINVKKEEIPFLNDDSQDLCDLDNKKYTPITEPGEHKLTGRQAVNYARIRYVGNGDFERTERQRRVLNEIFKSILSSDKSKYPQIINSFLPFIETSMSKTDILKISASFFTSGISKMDQARFPMDGYCSDKIINGIYYLELKQPATKNQIDTYIFDDVPLSNITNK